MLLVVESTRFVVVVIDAVVVVVDAVVVVVDAVVVVVVDAVLVGEASVLSAVVSPGELVPSAIVVLSLLVVGVARVELVTGTDAAVLVSPSSLRLSRMPWTTKPAIAALTSSSSLLLSMFTSRLTILGPITC